MPFALVTIGAMLFVTALNGTTGALAGQVYKDLFQNTPSFFYWVLALLVVGFIGYIPGAKKPSDAFIFLIIIAMVLKTNGGLFSRIEQVVGNNSETSPSSANPLQAVTVNAGGSKGSTSNPISSIQGAIGTFQSDVSQVSSGVNAIKGLFG